MEIKRLTLNYCEESEGEEFFLISIMNIIVSKDNIVNVFFKPKFPLKIIRTFSNFRGMFQEHFVHKMFSSKQYKTFGKFSVNFRPNGTYV